MNDIKVQHYAPTYNDSSIRVSQLFITIFHKCMNVVSSVLYVSYYAGIMLNAFIDPLCLKLCWHKS